MDVKTFGEDVIKVIQDNNYYQRNTGSGVMSFNIKTPIPGQKWELKEIRISLSAAGTTGTLTVRQSASNTTYATVRTHLILSQDMTSVTDITYTPDSEMIFEAADRVNIGWANTAAITFDIEARVKPIW